MEFPPSYETAIEQPNAFGGRIGVFMNSTKNSFHACDDSELCSQANRGVPVSIQNLVRQVTVHLECGGGGGGGGGSGGGDCRQEECSKKKTVAVTAIVLILILLCIYLLSYLRAISKTPVTENHIGLKM